MKYLNKRNGKVAELIQENEKFKTVLIKYEDDKESTVTISTLKRWWKPLSEEEVEKEEVSSDGTHYVQVMEEIIEGAKNKVTKKSSKKVKSTKIDSSIIEEGIQYVYSIVNSFGDKIFAPSNGMKMRAFKVGGHMYVKFDFSNKSFSVAVKGIALPENFTKPTRLANHTFNYVYKFEHELADTDKELIKDILTYARTYRVNKNNKTQKEEK